MQHVTLARETLIPDSDQPRRSMDEGDLKQLALSIREFGLLQPLIVYRHTNGYVIVDGHRRHAAAGMAGIVELAALVLETKPDADTLLLTQLAANCVRSDLKPSERAMAYQRLKESRGWSHSELAGAMHISKSKVTQTLSILTLPNEARALLDAGRLSESTAYAITREPDAARRKDLLAAAVKGELKRDEAVRRVSRRPEPTPRVRSTFRLPSAEVVLLTEEEPGINKCMDILKQLIGECRRAAKQALNVRTLESILADKEKGDS